MVSWEAQGNLPRLTDRGSERGRGTGGKLVRVDGTYKVQSDSQTARYIHDSHRRVYHVCTRHANGLEDNHERASLVGCEQIQNRNWQTARDSPEDAQKTLTFNHPASSCVWHTRCTFSSPSILPPAEASWRLRNKPRKQARNSHLMGASLGGCKLNRMRQNSIIRTRAWCVSRGRSW